MLSHNSHFTNAPPPNAQTEHLKAIRGKGQCVYKVNGNPNFH